MTYYKGFDKDLKCRGMQFEIGETYDTGANEDELELCTDTVFHFCDSVEKVHIFYDMNKSSHNRLCEIEPLSKIVSEENKLGTNKIKIVREIIDDELDDLLMRKNGNTGIFNIGYRNSGYLNSGDYNSGNWNACNHSTGFFNTQERTITIFNQDSGMTYDEFINSKYYDALTSVPLGLTKWLHFTDEEKKDSIEKQSSVGKLISYTYKEACQSWWNELSNSAKEIIMEIPNFDKDIFYEITGIEVQNDSNS